MFVAHVKLLNTLTAPRESTGVGRVTTALRETGEPYMTPPFSFPAAKQELPTIYS